MLVLIQKFFIKINDLSFIVLNTVISVRMVQSSKQVQESLQQSLELGRMFQRCVRQRTVKFPVTVGRGLKHGRKPAMALFATMDAFSFYSVYSPLIAKLVAVMASSLAQHPTLRFFFVFLNRDFV